MRLPPVLFLPWLSFSVAEADDPVVALTSETFDKTIKKHERVLVEFYAPWCGHCKKLAPEYLKAAKKLKENGFKTVLAKVDATVVTDVAKTYGVEGYPTMRYFVKGKLSDQEVNERDGDKLAAVLEHHEAPAFKELAENQVLEFLNPAKSLKTEKALFNLIGRVAKKSSRATAFKKAAEFLKYYDGADIRCAVVWLPKDKDAQSDASLVMTRPNFQDPDKPIVTYDGKWMGEDIAKWAKLNVYPTVGIDDWSGPGSTEAKSKKYMMKNLAELGFTGSVVLVHHNDLGQDDGKNIVSRGGNRNGNLLAMSKLFPKWKFSSVDSSKLKVEDKKMLGIVESGFQTDDPQITAFVHTRKYVLLKDKEEDLLQEETLKEFLTKVRDKKISPTYLSEDVPEEPADPETGLVTLVGDTFDKIVMDPKKDVLVEFYAPWCGHCKQLEPTYKEVAAKVKENGWKNVVIAKMDASANECELIGSWSDVVTGYPTVLLFPAVKATQKVRKRVSTDARTVDKLIDFLVEHAKNLEDVEVESTKEGGKGRKYNLADREKQKKAKKSEL